MSNYYDDPSTCACCGNDTYTRITDIIANNPCEIEVDCFHCGFSDFWGYGYSQGISLGYDVDHRTIWRLRTGQVVLAEERESLLKRAWLAISKLWYN